MQRLAFLKLAGALRRLALADHNVVPGAPPRHEAIGTGLAIVIPERGTPELLAECLASLRVALLPVDEPRQIVVHVNGAPRRRYTALRMQFPEVQWLFTRRGLGFSAAVRRALRAVHQPWVYLLNSDMRVEAGALRELLAWRAPFVFALASQIFFVDQTRRREETGWTDIRVSDDHVDVVDVVPEDDCVRGNVYAGGGSSLFQSAILRQYIEQGRGYDPFYFEDVEWGLRAWRDGRLVLFCPRSRVHHHHRATVNRYYTHREVDRIVDRNLWLLRLRLLPLPRDSSDLPGDLRRVRRQLSKLPWRTLCELMFTSRLRDAARQRRRVAAAPYGLDLIRTARLHRFVEPFATGPERQCAIVATPFLPYPTRHGGAVRTAALVNQLARRFRVVVLSDEATTLMPLTVDALEGAAALFVVSGRVDDPGAQGRLARAHTHTHPLLRQAFELLRTTFQPRIVQVEHVELAPLVTQRKRNEAWALDLHDVTLGVDDDEQANRAERAWLRLYDVAVVCSREDSALLSDAGPQVLEAGNGIDLRAFTYTPSRERNAVLFLGPFRYAPNRIAIERFVREVWPAVLAAIPSAELWILGGDDAPTITRSLPAFAQAGVRVHGHEPQPRAFLDRCALTINPQRAIRGSSLKVIESLAAGRVCVSTEDGARGFVQDDFPGLVVVDDVPDMARPVIELLRDADRRLHAEPPVSGLLARYAWPTVGDNLLATYDRVIAASVAPTTKDTP